MPGKIAITPRSLSAGGHPALSQLTERGYELVFPSPGKTPSIEDLSTTIPNCVGWLAGVEPIPGSLLQEARDLRVISRNGTGVDNIEMPVAASPAIRKGLLKRRADRLRLRLAASTAKKKPRVLKGSSAIAAICSTRSRWTTPAGSLTLLKALLRSACR